MSSLVCIYNHNHTFLSYTRSYQPTPHHGYSERKLHVLECYLIAPINQEIRIFHNLKKCLRTSVPQSSFRVQWIPKTISPVSSFFMSLINIHYQILKKNSILKKGQLGRSEVYLVKIFSEVLKYVLVSLHNLFSTILE